MKKLTILLFTALISFSSYGFFGLFEDPVCIEKDGQIRSGIVYLPNQTNGFTGKNLCVYKNGQKKSEGDFKDGMPNGELHTWYENGQQKVETSSAAGVREGKWSEWYENGQKKEEGNFKDDKKDGEWTEWNESGQIEGETNYKGGKIIDGKDTVWHEDGQRQETNYKGGKKDGKETIWFENGQIQVEMNFKDGKEDGKFIVWQWDEDVGRTIWIEGNYKDGKAEGKETTYWPLPYTGKQYEGNYKDGKRDGKWTTWGLSIDSKNEIYYKDGKCISGDCSLLVP